MWQIVKIWEVPTNDLINNFLDYLYFQIVVQSTVGFGDKVFVSYVGKFFVLILNIIVSLIFIAALASFVGKFHEKFFRFCRKVRVRNMENHRVIISDIASRAIHHCGVYRNEKEPSDVAVCSTVKAKDNLSGGIWFEYNEDDIPTCLSYLNISLAQSINVEVQDDGIAALICSEIRALAPNVRIVVTLKSDRMEKVFKRDYGNITVLPPTPEELVTAATTNRGLYEIIRAACSKNDGDIDAENIVLPRYAVGITKKCLLDYLSKNYINIVFIGVIRENEVIANPSMNFELKPGDELMCYVEPNFDPNIIRWDKI